MRTYDIGDLQAGEKDWEASITFRINVDVKLADAEALLAKALHHCGLRPSRVKVESGFGIAHDEQSFSVNPSV